MADALKQLIWIGSSKKVLTALPEAIRKKFGYALQLAQQGEMPLDARPLKGFGGASVLELRGDYDGNTFRAIYTIRFARFVYVLHVFQKKSKRGIKTPANIIDLLKKRLRTAEEDYEERNEEENNES